MPTWVTAILAFPHIHLVIIAILIMMFLVSVFGNIGIDWTAKKFTFGSQTKQRTCSDCIRLLMAKRTGFEVMYNTKHSSILRQQMIFAEHKLIEIEQIISHETRCAFKDELRRSFKENGFQEMNANDYEKYIQERTETLMAMLNSTDIKLPNIIRDIYNNAKSVKARLDLEIKKLEEDFCIEIDQLVKTK